MRPSNLQRKNGICFAYCAPFTQTPLLPFQQEFEQISSEALEAGRICCNKYLVSDLIRPLN